MSMHLGGADPPHWVCRGFVILGNISVERGVGGGLTIQCTLWLWEIDFSALGSLATTAHSQ